LVWEGLCTAEEALLKVEPDHIKQVLHPDFVGIGHLQGQYCGDRTGWWPWCRRRQACLFYHRAEETALADEAVLLVRENTSPEDVGGMWAAKGILTSRGGVTSHAAVVARGWGKPCVVGCEQVEIDEKAKTLTIKATGEVFKEGQVIL
jgi:pyruvate,orthophosphate dikinase